MAAEGDYPVVSDGSKAALPPPKSCTESGSEQSDISNGEQGGVDEFPRIPEIIHHIWMGGAMSSAALTNVKSWGQKAQDAGWTINLWTDFTSNAVFTTGGFGKWGACAALRKQLDKIEDCGINIRDMHRETPMVNEGILDIYATVVANPEELRASPGNLAFASDIARYCILRREGGVYIDVDVGPGTVDLTEQLRHLDRRGLVPHLGTPWRKQGNADDQMREKFGRTLKNRRRMDVFYLAANSVSGNHFIATREGADFLTQLLQMIRHRYEELGMLNTVVTGIGILEAAIIACGGEIDPHQGGDPFLRVTPWIGDLDWITGDS